ncbi:16S rRNA (guanine(527)-N(7))-methyltransferase RsmG [Natronoglycomyces albus]|uniref:Ribosomal RNA small subunit methyltransferase G n=1 Tax=Natronoglycomyces albus TaxID=2811108 RepID=A0A895XV27_9ACTN|nr:16S rRNA (guanine(527)-N(7))-methyltransferase RsmG [Natronoglycomyces albus]
MERMQQVEDYVGLLATEGMTRGLLGPREVPRLWDRHVLNCAVVGELIERESDVIDVGSGAGLPGIPLALARPDLWVTLVEPMQRRVAFLEEVVQTLGIPNVEVVRARAEEVFPQGRADVAVSRAVAPLGKLARWCLPLVRKGSSRPFAEPGTMLAIKGRSVIEEANREARNVRKAGGGDIEILTCGETILDEVTTVARIDRVR